MALQDIFSKVSGGASSVAKYAKPLLKKAPIVGGLYSLFGNPAKAGGGDEGQWIGDSWVPKGTVVGNPDYYTDSGASSNEESSQLRSGGYQSESSPVGGNSYGGRSEDVQSKFKNNLGKNYNSFKDSLDDLSGFTRADEDRIRSSIGGMRGQLRGGLETNLQAQKGVLDKEHSNVQSNQRDSLRDLSNMVQTEMKTGNDYLGTRGAADSSASQMYARGLMGEAGKNRRGILDQAREQYGEIETKRKQADQFYEIETSNIDRWAEESINSVKNSFAEQRAKLERLAKNADDYEMEDLENLDTKNLEKAYQKISEIDNTRGQWMGQLDTWRGDVNNRMDNLKKELVEMTSFSAQDIEMPELNAEMEDYRQNEQEEELNNPLKKRRNSLRDFLDNPLSDEDFI